MKKQIIILGAIFFSYHVFGQQQYTREWMIPQKRMEQYSVQSIKGPQKSLGDTVWSENFDNDIPSGWKNSGFVINGDDTTSSTNAKWEYRGVSTNPNVSVGSRGGCMNDTLIVESPTKGNGFVIFDSNYLDDTGGKCPPSGPKGAAPAPHIGILETNAIDLTGKTSIALSFYYFARNFKATQSVKISTDGGLTWDEIWEADIKINTFSFIDDRVKINISCYAANQSDVRFQFVFDGNYYAWMLDDIAITEVDPDELKMEETYYANNNNYEYTFMPYKQAVAGPYLLTGAVIASGADAQNNIILNVDVKSGSKSVFSNSTAPSALQCDTAFISADPFIPSTTGSFNAALWLTSDSINSDTSYKSFDVTDSVYARDNMWNASKLDNTLTLGASCGRQEIGYPFEIFTDQVATSITSYFSSKSKAKAIVYGVIYEVTNDGSKILIEQTPDHSLTASDITTHMISLSFSQPVILSAGSVYYACVGGYSGADTSVIAAAGDVSTGYAYLHDVDGGCEKKVKDAWYYMNMAPVVRLNVNDPNGISEIKNNIAFYTHPNPASDYFNVVITNVKKDNYNFEIRNILGKLIYQENTYLKNSIEKKFDISNYPQGIYFLTIRNSYSETTQKIVVK